MSIPDVVGLVISVAANIVLLCLTYDLYKKNKEYEEKFDKNSDTLVKMKKEIDELNKFLTGFHNALIEAKQEVKDAKEDANYRTAELRKQLNAVRSQIRQQRSDFRRQFKR